MHAVEWEAWQKRTGGDHRADMLDAIILRKFDPRAADRRHPAACICSGSARSVSARGAEPIRTRRRNPRRVGQVHACTEGASQWRIGNQDAFLYTLHLAHHISKTAAFTAPAQQRQPSKAA